jgi:regulator of sigma E protease
MNTALTILIDLVSVAFALGVIIVVHEAGHLLMAKTFGVRVLTYSIGFGKRLAGFRRGETDYRVSAVPLGGYVRLDGENPDESSGDPRQFLSKPRWQRVLIFLAGPAMNVVLSIAIFTVLFMVGIQVSEMPATAPIIGSVEEGSSAAHAGLHSGDLIVGIKGERAKSWRDVSFALAVAPDKPVPLEIKRGEHTFAATVTPKRVPQYEMGDLAGLLPVMQAQIRDVQPGKPAAAAGLLSGDTIRSVAGLPVLDPQDFVQAIEQRAGRPVPIEVTRAGKLMRLTVVPALEGKVGKIGVSVERVGPYQHYPPLEALRASLALNVEIVSETFQVLGKVFRREMSAKGALGGPIEIANQSGAAARRSLKDLFYVMGVISLSIALLNLMPIPILDGGQIFILLVEEVIRRDLSLRLKEVISQVGLVLILMLMVVAFCLDLSRHGWLPGL